MSAEAAAPMIATLTKMYDEFYAEKVKELKKKLKKSDFPWKEVTNDAGNETGEIEFRFKMVAKVDTKDGRTIEQRPILFDAKMRPMNDRVGGGSTIRVGFEPHLWEVPATGVGLSLRLKAGDRAQGVRRAHREGLRLLRGGGLRDCVLGGR
jgi:hypothetical protein